MHKAAVVKYPLQMNSTLIPFKLAEFALFSQWWMHKLFLLNVHSILSFRTAYRANLVTNQSV